MTRYKTILLVVLTTFCGVMANAAVTCTQSDYRGVYAYSSQGALIQLPPQGAALVGPFAQAGTIVSDGQGNLTLQTMASYNGNVLPGNTTATYTVTPDCQITFFVALPLPLNISSQFAGVLAWGARQTALMITVPQGSVLPAQQFKQDIRMCGPGDVNGSFQLSMGGSIVAPKQIAGLYSSVGRLVTDGNGNFTGTQTSDYNGGVVQETLQGTYNVTGDCIVTFNYTLNGQQYLLYGPLTGHGEQALLLQATQGWAVTGTLRSQQ